MKRFTLYIIMLLMMPLFCVAQNSKNVKALQKQKAALQSTIKKSQSELTKTKQKVKAGQKTIHYLGQQLDNRLDYIKQLESDMNTLDADIAAMQIRINKLESELKLKREKLKQALRYARSQKEINSPLMFILSAKTISQMYRRARYAKEYATYQHDLGEQIMHKQADLLEEQNHLLATKSKKNGVLCEIMQQRKSLSAQQVQETKNVAGLKKQETGLVSKIAQQQKQLSALDKKIDALIAYEIEQARKRAEEAARKKAAAEEAARRKAAEAKALAEAKAKGQSTSKTTTTTTTSKSTSSSSTQTATVQTKPTTWLTAEDRQLNGTFEQNKGRLPVPITGQYMLGNRFGMYNVPGLKNVQLDNKGTNYVGKPGARARSIFDGVVSAVFQFGGTKNVLVRHGSYISVYCNLSSVIVAKGQKVHTRDVLGTVADDGSGNCVLHFQLRKETAKLNPEAWLGR